MSACPWSCPVCACALDGDRATLRCAQGHSFDVAHEGYVNLLVAGQRRSRQPGDSPEMVRARRRFLATGAYDRVTAALCNVTARAGLALHEEQPAHTVRLLDVGCGDGHHTRAVAGNMTAGAAGLDPLPTVTAALDVSKSAIAAAARADPIGWYAVATASDLPVATASVDLVLNVFGPIVPAELARVVRPGGIVVAAHPGPSHLDALRAMVYGNATSHEVKGPLRDAGEEFSRVGSVTVTFPMAVVDAAVVHDLFTMTPYRWHAPKDIGERIADAVSAPGGLDITVDVVMTSYARRP